MGFISKTFAASIAITAIPRSTFYSVFRCPEAEKLMGSAVAFFLPDGHGEVLIEFISLLQNFFPRSCTVVDLRIAIVMLSVVQNKSQRPSYNLSKSMAYRTVPDFAYYQHYATAAYGKRKSWAQKRSLSHEEHIMIKTGVEAQDLSAYVDTKAVHGYDRLEHFVATDRTQKSVVLALMGTQSLESVVKDLRAEYVTVPLHGQNHDVHGGMWASARDMVNYPELITSVTQALANNPGFQLVVVGHSLGGGVAALLTMLLAAEPEKGSGVFFTNNLTVPGRPIICYGFGPAACMDEDLAAKTRNLIYSIVNKNDIVPSLCHGTFIDLKNIGIMLKTHPFEYAKLLDSIMTGKLDADEHLKSFQNLMSSKKLVPPGRVWTIVKNRPLGVLEIREVLDVGHRFAEARFVGGMKCHHSLAAYALSLQALS